MPTDENDELREHPQKNSPQRRFSDQGLISEIMDQLKGKTIPLGGNFNSDEELFDPYEVTEKIKNYSDPEWEEKGAEHIASLLNILGVATHEEGLAETPRRLYRALLELTTPRPFKFTMFPSPGIDEMIIEKDIPFYSLCEHHVLPFFGTAAVAYIPGESIAGLSKLARTVQYFAAGLQTQEYLTHDIADAIDEWLQPKGVAVMLRARHLCMEIRGVKAPGVETVTSCMKGVFHPDEGNKARDEFLQLIK